MKRGKETPSPIERKRMENKSDQDCEVNEYLCTDGNLGQWNDFENEGLQVQTIVVILKELRQDIKEMKQNQDKILSEITKIQNQVKDHEEKLSTLKASQDKIDHRVSVMEKVIKKDFDPELTIVAINAPKFSSEDPFHLARGIIEATGSDRVDCIVNAMHTSAYRDKKSVFKIEMATLEDMIDVLRKKKNLKHCTSFGNVYLHSSQTSVRNSPWPRGQGPPLFKLGPPQLDFHGPQWATTLTTTCLMW